MFILYFALQDILSILLLNFSFKLVFVSKGYMISLIISLITVQGKQIFLRILAWVTLTVINLGIILPKLIS